MKSIKNPILQGIWLVVQENEGLILYAFTKYRSAVAKAKVLSRKSPCVRTEVAKYFVALNSVKRFGGKTQESE